jgi:hypothetical protein
MISKTGVSQPHWDFLDIEASGLGPTSYPIEVGWASLTGEVQSLLIRPSASWRDDEWDDMAADVHGIQRAELKVHGRSAWDVAIILNRELAQPGMTVLSDAPGQDEFWLDRLFAESPVARGFRLTDFAETLAARNARPVDEAQFAGQHRRHRAAADVTMLRDIWRRSSN